MLKKERIILKTNIAICVIIFIGFSMTSFLSYRSHYSTSIKNIEQVSLLTSHSIYYQLSTLFSKPVHVSQTMANDPLLEDVLSQENSRINDQKYIEELMNYLKSYQEEYQYDSVFFVSKNSNRYYHFNGIVKTMKPGIDENEWYDSLVNSSQDYSLNIDNDEANHNEITVFVNCKVKNKQNQVLGVIGVGIRLEKIQEVFKQYEEKYHVHTYFINNSGNIEISTLYSGYQIQNFFEMKHMNSISDKILNWKDEENALYFWTDNQENHDKSNFIVTRYLNDLSWHLIVEQDNEIIINELKQQFGQTIVITMIILIGILFIVTHVIKGFHKLVEDRNIAFRKVTEQLYDNIYELNITKNCSANESTQRYFESLGADPSLPYNDALKVIAQKQIKEEFRKGYVETFQTDNVLKEYQLGHQNLRYDFMISEDGIHYYWMRIDALIYYNEETDCIQMFTYRKNIDKEKRQQEEMIQLAHYDDLTGLLNRKSTEFIIEKKLEQDSQQLYAFLILDIDNFKKANDLYGHDFGDHVLSDFGKLLKDNFRDIDVIGRIGGDEFVAFLTIPYLDFVDKKISKIIKVLSHLYVYNQKELKITTSIGVSLAPQDGQNFETLYKKADQALYETKKNGKNGYTIYHSQEENI